MGLTTILGCKESKTPELIAVKNQSSSESHPGKKLMETNCYVCHNPTTDHDSRIGPPMIAIKNHYLTEGMTKEEFVSSIQNWIENPTEDNSKMPGAVRRFGLMPKQIFPKETIQQISEYMYENDIEKPEWFDAHHKSEHGNQRGNGMGQGKMKQSKQQAQLHSDDKSYGERGLEYALSTKAVLGKNLMGTIQKKGTVAALEFCNEKAYTLTDSMAVVHNARIKRLTDQPRNQENKISSEDLKYLISFKEMLNDTIEFEPIVNEDSEEVNVYYPIVTNSMCLQCHGTPNETIESETLKTIARLYPNDKAKGYDVNQLRGIWKVTFEK